MDSTPIPTQVEGNPTPITPPPSPHFSHYCWIAQRVSQFRRLLGWRHEGPWRQGARFGGQVFRDLRGLVGCAAQGSRRGGEPDRSEAPDLRGRTGRRHRDLDAADADAHERTDLEQLEANGAAGSLGK